MAGSTPAARRLGEHLRQLRESRGWSLEYVARQVDMTFSMVRSIEMTRMSLLDPDELEAFAALYETTTDELLRVAGYELMRS